MPVLNPKRSGFLTRLDTRLGTFAGTSLVNPGSSAIIPIDAVAAAGGPASPYFARSLHWQLRSADDTAIRIARQLSTTVNTVAVTKDGLQEVIGVSGGTLDEAGVAAHCGTMHGYMCAEIDRSGNGRNMVLNTASANQPKQRWPKIYDASTGFNRIGNLIVSPHTSTSSGAVGNWFQRTDTCGLSGSPGFTIYVSFRSTHVTHDQIIFQTGGGFPTSFTVLTQGTSGGVGVANSHTTGGAARRVFTPVTAVTAAFAFYIFQIAPSANINTARCWQNGTELSQLEVSAGTLGIGGASTSVAGMGTVGPGSFAFNGSLSTIIAYSGAVLPAAAFNALVAFGNQELAEAT